MLMTMRKAVVALLGAYLLAACALQDVPLVQRALATPMPSPASAPTPVLAPTALPPTGVPLATPLPLPTSAPVPTLESTISNALEEEQRLLVELYRRVSLSVVSIEVLGGHPAVEGGPAPGENVPIGQGSGFLYDDQGHIVTNDHVVADASGFQVSFADGTIVEARLIGRDPGSDLAVLKVDELPPGAAPLALADSRQVAVGQTAIAIGNPFGLQNTLTVGVVSGVGRSLEGPPSEQLSGSFVIPNLIQTDAAINPGNSGGPLLNVRGQVIGVNTAIRSESGTFQGVGYAVPSNAVARVVPALIRAGRYEHPWLGIVMRDVDPLLARQFGLAVRQGVLILEIQPGSPAERAGLRGGQRTGEYAGRSIPYDGDIITAIDGQAVRSGDDLISYLELETSVGDVVRLIVVRNGAEQQVEVTLGSRPG
jgi:2-alkenal reductase